MRKVSFIYWKDSSGQYLGYLNEYPDHWTQGDDLDDLKDHLEDLLALFDAEDIPRVKRVAEMEVA